MKFKLTKDIPPYKAGLEVDEKMATDLNRLEPGSCVRIDAKPVASQTVNKESKTTTKK